MNVDDVKRVARLLRQKFPEGTFGNLGMDELLDMYAIFALTKGEKTTNRDVHHAWVLWARRYDPHNPDIRHYDDLPSEVKAEDSPFAHAIRSVAATL
ncbi:MAG: hypothetical protein WBP22_03855 [Candidatus Saccharimonas sp.]